jgi:hypothetical protein
VLRVKPRNATDIQKANAVAKKRIVRAERKALFRPNPNI